MKIDRLLYALIGVGIVVASSAACFGVEVNSGRAELVRTLMTVGGAAIGMGVMSATAFSLVPEGTSISDRLVVAIPSAALAAGLGAFTGRWIADITLRLRPPLAVSPLVGAGLGAAAGALVGGVGFAVAIAIAMPTVSAPPGYWGRGFTYLQAVGMGLVAGALWGGLAGLPTGAAAVPIISVYMGF